MLAIKTSNFVFASWSWMTDNWHLFAFRFISFCFVFKRYDLERKVHHQIRFKTDFVREALRARPIKENNEKRNTVKRVLITQSFWYFHRVKREQKRVM